MHKKRIVCFGDSNTWGYDGDTGGRYEDDVRWTGVLQSQMPAGYVVAEEGLSGRTTVFNDPLNPGMNGLEFLPVCLSTHMPVHFLVIMLGTNDCKQRFCATPKNIADGVTRLVLAAKAAGVPAAKILIVAPILINERYKESFIAGEMGEGCVEKAAALPALLEEAARNNGCHYLDANLYVKPNQVDFMHLDKESNTSLGVAIADKIKLLDKI